MKENLFPNFHSLFLLDYENGLGLGHSVFWCLLIRGGQMRPLMSVQSNFSSSLLSFLIKPGKAPIPKHPVQA